MAEKTLADQHATGIKSLDIELGGVQIAIQQLDRQRQALQARQDRLVQARNALLVLCGLEANAFYQFTEAKQKGRSVPKKLTQEDIERLAREQLARRQQTKVPVLPAADAATEPGA